MAWWRCKVMCKVSPAVATSVNALNLSVSNPPTQAQVQAVANKIDELLTALKRL